MEKRSRLVDIIGVVSLIAFISVGVLAGCSDKVPVVVTPDGTEIKNYHIGNNGISEPTFNYVQVDGHQYLMYFNGNHGGITHSPKCGCIKSGISADGVVQDGK